MDLLDQKAIKQPSKLSTEQNTLGFVQLLSLFRDHPTERANTGCDEEVDEKKV